jgi:2'-5' RNA ligase
MRLFFAAWPPPATAAALHRWADELAGTIGGRATRAENLHVTLAFLGTVAADLLPHALEAARRVTGRAHRLPIELARYHRGSRIVWAEPKELPPALAALVEGLTHALTEAGFALERRRFAAHVTLIRNAQKPPKLPPLPKIDWPIDEFVLVRSTPSEEGSHYEIVDRFSW